jgi:very-short-patch-repair endonuclease
METRLRLLIVLAGLPTPVPQHVVLDAAGRFVARLDLAYPEDRLGIGYDGDHHRERSTWTADLQRHNRLRLLGWTVLRFSAADVLGNPDKVLAQIRAALH